MKEAALPKSLVTEYVSSGSSGSVIFPNLI